MADCLAVDEDDVAAESRLIHDLGADSLDFIDLIFTLQKKFGVKFQGGQLGFLTRLDQAASDLVDGQFLPVDAVRKMLPWLPELQSVVDLSRVTPAQVLTFLRVETLWLMVCKELDENS